MAEQKGDYVPKGEWELTDLKVSWEGGTDRIYKKRFSKGTHHIGYHTGTNGEPGAPHALFISSEKEGLDVNVGINSPIRIKSKADKLERYVSNTKPGHWIYNDFNWNAVGSFVKQMPWDSKILEIEEETYIQDARVMAFERPDGKRVFVVSNRSGNNFTFNIDTQLAKSKWKGYRYTPWERGKNTMGTKVGVREGALFSATLPNLTWEFWIEQ